MATTSTTTAGRSVASAQRAPLVREAEEHGTSESSSSEDSESADEARRQQDLTMFEKEEMSKVQTVKASFRSPARRMILAGMLLAWCAGMVNATMVLEINKVVSHVTGHLTTIGFRLEGVRGQLFVYNTSDPNDHGDDVQSVLNRASLQEHLGELTQAVTVLSCFMLGSFLCGLLVPSTTLRFGAKSFYGTAMLGNSLLLVCGYCALVDGAILAAEGFTACACGMQNAMCTVHLGAVVRTTHSTGTATDIGSTLGRVSITMLRKCWGRRKLTMVEAAEVEVGLDKIRVLVALLLSFGLGTWTGALLFNDLGRRTLLVPAGVTFTMGILYNFFRERLKRWLKRYWMRQLASEMEEMAEALQHVQPRGEEGRRASTVHFASSVPSVNVSADNVDEEGEEEDEEEDADVRVEKVLEMFHELQEQMHSFVEQDHSGSRRRSRR